MFVEREPAPEQEYKEFWARLGRGEHQSGEYKRVAKGGRDIWIQAPITRFSTSTAGRSRS